MRLRFTLPLSGSSVRIANVLEGAERLVFICHKFHRPYLERPISLLGTNLAAKRPGRDVDSANSVYC
jgi:hypothetical protein